MPEIIIDADDFHEGNNRLDLLYRFRSRIPGFKITLFTVPALCGSGFVREMRAIDWIDLVPHGFRHPHPRECEHWTYEDMSDCLDRLTAYDWTHGWKSPGWVTTDGMFRALADRDYWVADQVYNNDRRPRGLKWYDHTLPGRCHYHIGNVCNNGIEECYEQIMRFRGDFKFAWEAVSLTG